MSRKERTAGISAGVSPTPISTVPEREVPAWINRVLDSLMLVGDEDTARRIFVRRAVEEIIQISQNLSIEAIEETASTNSGTLLLLRALQNPGLLPELEKYEPLTSPYLKGLEAQQEMLRTAGGLMPVQEVAQLLRISRQAVDKRRLSKKLLALPMQRAFGYPVCQFNTRGPIPGLEDVLAVLPTDDGWSQLTFLLSANAELNSQTPLTVLSKGHISDVLNAAERFGEHGAN